MERLYGSYSAKGWRASSRHVFLALMASVSLAGCAASSQEDLEHGDDVDRESAQSATSSLALRAASEVDVDLAPLCGLPQNQWLEEHAVELPEGYMDYQAWQADPLVQAELPALEAALKPFADEALEPVFDHALQQIVIPVDPDTITQGRVQKALAAAKLTLPLRVQSACRPVAALRAADQELQKSRWHPDALKVPYAIRLDSSTAQLVLTFEGAAEPAERAANPSERLELVVTARSAAQAAATLWGDLVRIEAGDPGRHTRADDAQPHYGAAGIGNAGPNFCTAGPLVYTGVGTQIGAVTAGHCFDNGDAVTSGIYVYGVASSESGYPTYDMILIEPDGQTFTKKFYTDPGAPTSRTQTKKIDAPVGSLVCISGAVNKAICNIEVTSVTSSLCVGGCTTNLSRGSKPGVVLSQAGDSGAPMYYADGATGAYVLGMAIGSINAVGDVLWHKQSTIESHLGVTIAL